MIELKDSSELAKQAEKGDADAQFRLGVVCHEGRGVVQSDETAVFWYRKAAEQGHRSAQHNLGVCYYEGQGVRIKRREILSEGKVPKSFVPTLMYLEKVKRR